jgi:hypothetical protein
MFLLKGLSSIVFGSDASGDERGSLLQLPEGELWYNNPMDYKASRRLIYPRASMTLVRTSSPFNYQLLVTRILEDGEQELLEEESVEEETQRSFLVDAVLKLRVVGSETDCAFVWFDLDHPSRICSWEFVAEKSKTNSTTLKLFEETLYQCMYERQYAKHRSEENEGEFRAFVDRLVNLANGRSSSPAEVL